MYCMENICSYYISIYIFLSDTEPIYECNSCCSCSVTCINRLVQRGIMWDTETFQTDQKGIGLQTRSFIKKGSFVIEYIGEVLTINEAYERTSKLKTNEKNFLFTLNEHYGESLLQHHVDARYTGNMARYINHSCDPNLVMVPVRINSVFPHLVLFSLHDIQANEELTF